ncbi:hypothetical protein HBB04_03062 [Pseudomonas coronafaciens]|nr:hypothetical protein HBB04_03062 [Pseudomonas coronafaciens]
MLCNSLVCFEDLHQFHLMHSAGAKALSQEISE